MGLGLAGRLLLSGERIASYKVGGTCCGPLKLSVHQLLGTYQTTERYVACCSALCSVIPCASPPLFTLAPVVQSVFATDAQYPVVLGVLQYGKQTQQPVQLPTTQPDKVDPSQVRACVLVLIDCTFQQVAYLHAANLLSSA